MPRVCGDFLTTVPAIDFLIVSSAMSDDDENHNGQNPIPELTNLNINNFTLSQLHELRNAINIRIDELAPPPPVAMDLADVLQLQNVVVAVRKTI